MLNLKDVCVDFPVDVAHNVLRHIVANCGIESVLLSLSEIVADEHRAQYGDKCLECLGINGTHSRTCINNPAIMKG